MIQDILQFIFKLIQEYLPAAKKAVAAVKNGSSSPSQLAGRIKKFYIENGYTWGEINIGVVRDTYRPATHQVYNDVLFLATDEGVDFYACTSEPGLKWTPDKMNKYGVSWVGLYPYGFYPKNFYVSTYQGLPAMRQRGQVKLMEIKNGQPVKLRKGGGCHIHGRSDANLKGEAVGYASAGCQVFRSNESLKEFVGKVKQSRAYQKDKKTAFDFMVCSKDSLDLSGVVVR